MWCNYKLSVALVFGMLALGHGVDPLSQRRVSITRAERDYAEVQSTSTRIALTRAERSTRPSARVNRSAAKSITRSERPRVSVAADGSVDGLSFAMKDVDVADTSVGAASLAAVDAGGADMFLGGMFGRRQSPTPPPTPDLPTDPAVAAVALKDMFAEECGLTSDDLADGPEQDGEDCLTEKMQEAVTAFICNRQCGSGSPRGGGSSLECIMWNFERRCRRDSAMNGESGDGGDDEDCVENYLTNAVNDVMENRNCPTPPEPEPQPQPNPSGGTEPTNPPVIEPTNPPIGGGPEAPRDIQGSLAQVGSAQGWSMWGGRRRSTPQNRLLATVCPCAGAEAGSEGAGGEPGNAATCLQTISTILQVEPSNPTMPGGEGNPTMPGPAPRDFPRSLAEKFWGRRRKGRRGKGGASSDVNVLVGELCPCGTATATTPACVEAILETRSGGGTAEPTGPLQ